MLNVIYEDNHILIAFKEYGVLSQKDNSNEDSMVEIVKAYLKEKYHKEGNIYLGLLHRLDRNTAGIMCFAKTSKAAERLSAQISKHLGFNKRYLCICKGHFKEKEGILKNKLLKNEKENKSYESKDGKDAILEYKVLDTINDLNLVDINLLTGRHHQIRCQMALNKTPLYNDKKYGDGNGKYCLEEYELKLIHPVKKEEMTFKYFKSYSLFDKFDVLKYINQND
jgi:23S rRNA pseudouridine1911/1915/1917 synthase